MPSGDAQQGEPRTGGSWEIAQAIFPRENSDRIEVMSSNPCEYCGNEVPPSWHYCPHCARPALFPNVKAAQVPAEKEALERRYQNARREASNRGADADIEKFETALANSKAVIARSYREVDRLAASDKELYSTYYKLLGAESRLPDGDQWDPLRRLAEETLFPNYKEEIRFAALSLAEVGLSNYGECSLVLRDDMITHRASVFEENPALFLKRHSYRLRPGHRAVWEERAKLCVAKLVEAIGPGTPEGQFASILLRPGATSGEDDFVEVHIWGPMSLRTVERILMPTPSKKAFRRALRDRLKDLDVIMEETA